MANDTNQDNLSMKYNYGQLDAPHKAIADQIAALLIAYPDVVKLNDPVAQQKFMSDVENSGVGSALAGLGDAGKGIAESIRNAGIPVISSAMGAAKHTADAASAVNGVVEGAGKGVDIASSLVTIPGAGIGTYLNEAKIIFNDMTPEKARNIGAHYASVLQAQEQGRTAAGIGGVISGFQGPNGGVMKGLGNMWDYVVAGVKWAFDNLSALATGKPAMSFAEHLSHQRFSNDLEAVRDNMSTATDLPHVRNLSAATLAHALTEGAEVQNRAGANTTLAAPTADTQTPMLPNAKKDASGNVMVAPSDMLAVQADAKNKAGAAISAKAGSIFGAIDTVPKAGGAVLGTAAVGSGVRGIKHGIERAPVKQAEVTAIKATTAAEKLESDVAKLEARLAPDSAERKLHHKVGGKKVAGKEVIATEAEWEKGLEAKLTAAQEKQGHAIKVAEEAKEVATVARAGLSDAAAKLHHAPAGSGITRRVVSKAANAPHNIGRGIGERLWNWVSPIAKSAKADIETMIGGAKDLTTLGKNIPEQVHAGAASKQAAMSAAELEKTKAALEAAKAEVAAHESNAAGKGISGFFRTASNRASEAEKAAHARKLVAELEGKVHVATGNGVAKALHAEAAALPKEVAPNLFHGIGSLWGRATETVTSWFGKVSVATAKAGHVAQVAAKADTAAAHTAEAAEATLVATRVAEGASKVAGHGGGGWIKAIIAFGAALVGGTAAGVAEAHTYDATPQNQRRGNKAVAVAGAAVKGGLWDTLGGAIGLPDFAKGDIARGVGSIAGLAFIPGADAIDEYRQGEAADKVPAALVSKLNQLVTGTGKTGNVYLDRVAELKAMQARGVKEVAMAPSGVNPLWSVDTMGEVRHEGAAMNFAMSPDAPQEITSSIQEAIDLNLRLYVVKGGSLKAAQDTFKPAAPAGLTAEQLAAAHDGVVQQARMAVNRAGSAPAKLDGFNLGMKGHSVTVAMGSTVTPGSHGGTPQPTAQHAVA